MNSIDLFELPSRMEVSTSVGCTSILEGKTALAVDVLRAGTTISAALDAGARFVFPCQTIEQANQVANDPILFAPKGNSVDTTKVTALNDSRPLLGGERKGLPIDGFDLSNSPLQYTPEAVSDRNIVFTTTNGTLAIEACRQAEEVLVGSFVNLTSIARRLWQAARPVAIICAGTDGSRSTDDILFGGAVIELLLSFVHHENRPEPEQSKMAPTVDSVSLNSSARDALELWTQHRQNRPLNEGWLYDALCQTEGGVNLVRLQFQDDIRFAATCDQFDLVPVFDAATGRIRADVDLPAAGG